MTINFRWNSPKFDGGRPITHYIVEQKAKFEIDYHEVQTFPSNQDPQEAIVSGLKESNIYEFRVRAFNKAGQSKPCEPTQKHVCKHRNCK